jgi:signal transduction histidine kinase
LLAIIGHDLRTAVFQLNGLIYLLRHVPEGLDRSRSQAYLDDVECNLNHVTRTIEDLLHWSEDLQDNRTTNQIRIILADILALAVDSVGMLADRKGITLHLDCPDSMTIHSDPDIIAAILRNLLGNALKFSEPGGVVRIVCEEQESACVIAVHDEGIGIKASDLEHIFEPCSRRGRLGTAGEKGLGVGLTICRQLALSIGGDLQIDSAPGQGTSARLILRTSVIAPS